MTEWILSVSSVRFISGCCIADVCLHNIKAEQLLFYSQLKWTQVLKGLFNFILFIYLCQYLCIFEQCTIFTFFILNLLFQLVVSCWNFFQDTFYKWKYPPDICIYYLLDNLPLEDFCWEIQCFITDFNFWVFAWKFEF